jgi:import inner membrane translocase subunit TIM13
MPPYGSQDKVDEGRVMDEVRWFCLLSKRARVVLLLLAPAGTRPACTRDVGRADERERKRRREEVVCHLLAPPLLLFSSSARGSPFSDRKLTPSRPSRAPQHHQTIQTELQQVQATLRMQYVQEFYQTVRDKCFKICVTSPGSSLSSSEQKCLGRCMDRYQDVRLCSFV